RLEPSALEERADGARLLVNRLLDGVELSALVREIDRPGREIGGDIALGNAPHSHGPVLRHLGAPEAIAQRVAARRKANRENRDRAQKDGAAVLQLVDHGSL